jgi:hypothetical protein
MRLKTISRMCAMCTLTIAAVLAFSALGLAQAYKQTNLDSDIQGLAQNPPNGQPDTQLVNPWGLIASPTSPWWLSDNNAGVSTLDDGQGVKQGLVVNIPSPVNGWRARQREWFTREPRGSCSKRRALLRPQFSPS